jgi:uncharacterized protein
MKIYINENLLDFNVLTAVTFLERAGGLLFRPKLNINELLLLKPCSSIHTIGMKYDIDIIYLSKKGEILKIIKNLKPLKFSICFRANMVLEFASSELRIFNFKLGDQVVIRD